MDRMNRPIPQPQPHSRVHADRNTLTSIRKTAAARPAVTLSNITRSPRQLLTLSNRKRFPFAGF